MTYADRYILMCRNHEVASFAYSPRTRSVRSVEACSEPRYAPPSVLDASGMVDAHALSGWVSMRYIPHTREGISGLLRAAGCSDPAELMFSSLGLNLSDQYWFKPAGIELNWHDINYFENAYVDGRANTLTRVNNCVTYGPGTSTGGQVLKWWEHRDGTNYLVKGSTAYGHEPYAELLSTMLYERLLPAGSFVPYTLELREGEPYSLCPCFGDTATELATMDDVLRARYTETGFEPRTPEALLREYVNALEAMGLTNVRTSLAQTLICDYLIANADRHEYNLGVILDAESKAAVRIAPIYDNGRGFYYGAKRAGLLTEGLFDYASRPFDADPQKQLELALALDSQAQSWIDFTALDGFAQDIERVLGSNEYLPHWFAPAAAQQFNLRVAHLKTLLTA